MWLTEGRKWILSVEDQVPIWLVVLEKVAGEIQINNILSHLPFSKITGKRWTQQRIASFQAEMKRSKESLDNWELQKFRKSTTYRSHTIRDKTEWTFEQQDPLRVSPTAKIRLSILPNLPSPCCQYRYGNYLNSKGRIWRMEKVMK